MMPMLTRGASRIYYETYGEGPAILLSHAYGASAAMWERQREALSKNHQLILWDMRGHGRSETPDDPAAYSRESTLEDMDALMEECGASRVALGGLSMGGYMSLAYAVKNPSRLEALMLFDSGPGFKKPEALSQWNGQAERQARALEKRGLDAKPPAPPEVQHTDPQSLAHAARGMLAQSDTSVIFALEKIALPTLVVVGAEDKPFLAASDYMAVKIPNAQKSVLEGAAHYANYDKPHDFNEAVLSFLKGAKF